MTTGLGLPTTGSAAIVLPGTATEPTGDETAATDVSDAQDSPEGGDSEEAAKWKKLARENEAKYKRARAAEDELGRLKAQQEDAKRTDAEKVVSAQRERDDARTEAARWRVALRHGLSEEDVTSFISPGTEEQMEAAAKRLADRLAASPVLAPPPPSYDGGARQTAKGPANMDDVIRGARDRKLGG